MKFISLIIVIFTLTACKFELKGITDKKDDDNQAQEVPPCVPQTDGTCIFTPFVANQSRQICDKVNQCLGLSHGQDGEKCSRLLPYQIGLESYNQPQAKTYSALNKMYQKNLLNIDAAKWDECLAAINVLTCDSSTFTGAFNINDPMNYFNIHTILTASAACVNIYTVK